MTLTVTAGAADLAVTLTDMPDPVRRGRELTYTATVHNDGPDNAQDVALTLKLTGSAALVTIEGDVNPDTDCTITYKGSSSFPTLGEPDLRPGGLPQWCRGDARGHRPAHQGGDAHRHGQRAGVLAGGP